MRKPSGAALVACTTAFACGGSPPDEPVPRVSAAAASPSPAAAVAAHDIRGRITAIAEDRRTVTLDHEAIPGVMDAMTMDYRVDDPSVLEGLAAGDQVQGRIEVRPAGYYVVSLAR